MCLHPPRSKTTGLIDCILGVHVDDIIIAAPESKMQRVKNMLSKAYTMTDLGRLSWYLGIKVEWDDVAGRCYLSQEAMIDEILGEHYMGQCNRKFVPARRDFMRQPVDKCSEEEKQWMEVRAYTNTKYRALVGSLQYASGTCHKTRHRICCRATCTFCARPPSGPMERSKTSPGIPPRIQNVQTSIFA